MVRATYTVKAGDVLGKIAERHGCTVAQIKSWNNLSSNNIYVGQKLKVAAPKSSTTTSQSSGTSTSNGSYTTYTVKNGDSFYSIAKNYPGVSAQNIMDFNGLNSSNIKPGMVIKIPAR